MTERSRATTRREVLFQGDVGPLEGLLEFPEGGMSPVGAVVVAHPHPLHGGTMVQPVVHHVAKACRSLGLVTLRFNFRGVGESGGSYSGLDEHRDVAAAAGFLRTEVGEGLPVALAGYSFGSVMSALAVIEGEPSAGLALVAFPVDVDEFMPSWFAGLDRYSGPVLALCGETDDIAPPARVAGFLRGLGVDPQMLVVPGADHFFVRMHDLVGRPVGEFLREACLAAGTHAAGVPRR